MPSFPSRRGPAPTPEDPRGAFFPPTESPEYQLLAFRDRAINPWSVVRNAHMGRIGQAMWYLLGRQWSEFDYQAAFDGVRGAFLRDISQDDTSTVVRPVTNEVDPAVEAEVIALVKRRWTPKVFPDNPDPRIKAAAQVAHDRLNYRLEQISWREKRHQLGLHFAIGGTGLVYTSWDRSYMELRPVGAPTAVACPACSTKLYSADVPVDLLRAGTQTGPTAHLETARPVAPAEDEADINAATLSYCPTCPTPQPLQPYMPTPEEAQSATDVYGRPLGVDDAAGSTDLQVDLPFEFYPQDGGVRCTPDTLRRWGRRKVRSLEWIEERYPHLVASIQPDSISDLLYGDPLLGMSDVMGSWHASYDTGILDNHNNVDEVVELPSFRFPYGRYLVATKDRVLEDSDLLEPAQVPAGPDTDETETVYVPRVQMSASRYKIRPGEFWGTTIADHIISPQNRLNGLDSQIIETRLRLGPNVMMPADMWPDGGPTIESAGGVGNMIFLNPSIANPSFIKPEVIQGTLMPDGVYIERQAIQADIKRQVGPQDATMGQAPKNVGTTSGLQLLVEQDERSRSLREDELVNSVEKSWSHMLRLEWTLGLQNDDVYRVMGPGKAWKYEQYRGNALRGQTEVTIERGSFVTKSVVQREAAREALADQVLVLDSPLARRRVLEMYGIDTDINSDTTHQVDHAERLWVDFMDKGLVRVQDSIDDPALHYQVLGAYLRTNEGEQIADEAGWEDIGRAIAGWEDEYRNLVMMEAQSIAFYGSRLTQQEAGVAYAKAVASYQQAQDLYTQQSQIAAQAASIPQLAPGIAGTMPPAPPVQPIPPQEPPMPVYDIPLLLQDRIKLVWDGMRQKAGLPVGQQAQAVDGAVTRDPEVYVSFRALHEAYKMAGMMGGMTAGPTPAPGSGATMAPVDKGMPAGGPQPGPTPGNGAVGGGKVPQTAAAGPMAGGGAH